MQSPPTSIQPNRPYIEEGRPHIAVDSMYNADAQPNPEADARSMCRHAVAHDSKKPKAGPIPAGLKFPGRPTATCRLDYNDGSIIVEVMTMAGPRTMDPPDGPDVPAPDTDYDAILHTTAQRLDADLAVFRSVLKGVRIEKQ